jgi:hypothetical protein
MADVTQGYTDLSNGILPAAYAAARQQALNTDLTGTVGSAISSLANRGIVNSSVSNSALNNISQNASDTLAKNYTSDLATESGLLGNRASNIGNVYNTNQTATQNNYNASTGLADKTYSSSTDTAGKNYAAKSADNSNFYNASNTVAQNNYNATTGAADKTYSSATDVAGKSYAARSADNSSIYKAAADRTNGIYNAANSNTQNEYANRNAATNTLYGDHTSYAQNMYNARNASAQNNYNASTGLADKNYGSSTDQNSKWYATNSTDNSNFYKNATDNASSIYQTANAQANSLYGNQSSYFQNRLNAENAYEQNKLNGALMAQTAAFVPASTLYGYASQLAAPAQNMYNTMYSGRMGTGTTTSTTNSSDGGASYWQAAGQLGTAAIMCFTADTLVTTPDGYTPIKDIVVGDEVLSIEGGNIVTKKVKKVNPPHWMPIVDLTFDNGTIWHTTASQRYYDGTHFSYIDYPGKAVVFHGQPSKTIELKYAERTDLVYDFAVDGTNVFFANDVAAEGYGD